MEFKPVYSDELQHHGTKGMRWGRRLYQNPDGTLTALGKKRYNKEVDRLKKETEKVKAAEKVAANRKKVEDKFAKLDDKKAKLEERKKALKSNSDKKKEPEDTETVEQKRERLLKSNDAKDLFENRDALTTAELNDRINRIDTEMRLQSKIAVEKQKTASEWMDGMSRNINSATNLYKSVDGAYSTVMNSAIGKTLAKSLGLEVPKKKRITYDDFLKDPEKYSDEDVQKIKQRAVNENVIRNMDKTIKTDRKEREDAEALKEAAKKAAEEAEIKKNDAQKAVDEYNKSWWKRDKVGSSQYRKTGDDLVDSRTNMKDVESSDNYKTGESSANRLLPAVINDPKPKKPNDHEYVDKYKDGSETVYVYDNDAVKRASDALAKAAKNSSEAVSKVDDGRSFIDNMLKKNNDKLNGR